MNDTTKTTHFLVEAGPEKGRELTIPPGGARIGRSSSNDLVLDDPSLSRFHCRFYFKDGKDLAVSDLASTNETLVNDKPIQDMRLFRDDRVMIGETTLRVTCDTLFPADQPNAAGSDEIPPVKTPPAAPAGGGSISREIDLGLQPPPEPEAAPVDMRRLGRRAGWVVVGAIVVVAAAFGVKALLDRRGSATSVFQQGGGGLEIEYEKVQASPKNIFRYRLSLKDDVLAVRIDNLEDGRHLSREQKVASSLVGQLAQTVQQSGFYDLNDEYSGVVPEVWDLLDLTVTLDRRVQRVRVLNRIEPDTFKEVRETVEEFAHNQLGLFPLPMPPEKLKEMARDAWLQGQKLFDEREVRYENLSRAIKAFSEADVLLESIEPKPEYYAKAIAAREECKRVLQEKYEDYMFRAERAIKLREWKEANDNLQVVLQLIGDRSDERYDKAYKKLLDVQRNLEQR